MIRDYKQMLHVRSQRELRDRMTADPRQPTPIASGGPALRAYVNGGRLVADCPCGSGVACGLDDGEATCVECGLVHTVLLPIPEEFASVAPVLEQRPAHARNWRPGAESRADLVLENWLQGLPSSAGRDDRPPAGALRYLAGAKGRPVSRVVEVVPEADRKVVAYNAKGERVDERGKVLRGLEVGF